MVVVVNLKFSKIAPNYHVLSARQSDRSGIMHCQFGSPLSSKMWWKGDFPGCPASSSRSNVDLENEMRSLERYMEEAVHSMGFTTFNAARDIRIPGCIQFKPFPRGSKRRKSLETKSYSKRDNVCPSNRSPAAVDSRASTSASFTRSRLISRSASTPSLVPSTGIDRPGFRLSYGDASLVRGILLHSGLVPREHGPDWVLSWTGSLPKEQSFQHLQEWQRINHFPSSHELTRKDRLWAHYAAMRELFGAEEFDYLPETFVLPDEKKSFLDAHEKHPSWLWIVKPPSQSRGRGIFILRDLEDLPTDSSCVISRYIVDPYLIQGYKFDLRVYVLVTGFDPLRVYLYREGLTRLACSPFTVKTAEDLQNKYAHLTNYSICRSSDDYVENRDARVDHYGHKWSLSALNRHCSCSGLDVSEVWGSIIDIILKTLVASGRFGQIGQSGVGRRAAPSCFELFGFDILLDSKLKPWLIEVNLSPSLVADTPLDRKIKAHLISDILNLVGVPSSKSRGNSLQGYYVNTFTSTTSRLLKTPSFDMGDNMSHFMGGSGSRLDNAESRAGMCGFRGHDIDKESSRVLVQILGELRRHAGYSNGGGRSRDNFIRIYPTPESTWRFRDMLSPHCHYTRLINRIFYGHLCDPDRRSRTNSGIRRRSEPLLRDGIFRGIRLTLLLLEYGERLCIFLESLPPRLRAKLARIAHVWTKCESLAAQIPNARPLHSMSTSVENLVSRMRCRLAQLAARSFQGGRYVRGSIFASSKAKCRRYVPVATMKLRAVSEFLRELAAKSTVVIEDELTCLGFTPAFSVVMTAVGRSKSIVARSPSMVSSRYPSKPDLDSRRRTAPCAMPGSDSSSTLVTSEGPFPVGMYLDHSQVDLLDDDIDFNL